MTDTVDMLVTADSGWPRPTHRGACTRDAAAGPGTCWFWWEGCPQPEKRGCYFLWRKQQDLAS